MIDKMMNWIVFSSVEVFLRRLWGLYKQAEIFFDWADANNKGINFKNIDLAIILLIKSFKNFKSDKFLFTRTIKAWI